MLHIFVSNNIDTSRVTTKQYCKMILLFKFLSNKTVIFSKILLILLIEDVPNNTFLSFKYELIINLY